MYSFIGVVDRCREPINSAVDSTRLQYCLDLDLSGIIHLAPSQNLRIKVRVRCQDEAVAIVEEIATRSCHTSSSL